jgi:hypothetical protein
MMHAVTKGGMMSNDSIKNSDIVSGEPLENPQVEKKTIKREDRLLPFMTGLLVALAIFFLLVSTTQMAYLHYSISQSPPIDLNPSADKELASTAITFDERLSGRKLEILAIMEAFIVQNRYHQVNVSLMAGLWLRYLGFVTGMILSLVGASFVIGKLREPVTEIAGKLSNVNLSLQSASPGIILVFLGAVLMIATILDEDHYEVEDYRIYLTGLETPISEDLGIIAEPPPAFWNTPTPEATETP